MRAAFITEFNHSWVIRNAEEPKPGPQQVLIRIRASGMCGTDIHAHHGRMPIKLPQVAGHEPVGTIVETGAGVTDLRVGDRVGVCWHQKGCGRCSFCQQHRDIYCAEMQTWMNLGGGNAELMLAWASGCALIPGRHLRRRRRADFLRRVHSDERASQRGAAARRQGRRSGSWRARAPGHPVCPALGLEVFALTGTASKKPEALSLGAHEVIVASGDLAQALLKAGGADIILGTTNSAAHVTQALAGLRPEGRHVNMGSLDGPVQVDSLLFLGKQLRLIGSKQNHRRDLFEALELVAAGKVKPMIEAYPFDKINEVRDRLEAGKVRYRAVLSSVS